MIKLPVDVANIIRILEEAGYEAYAVGGCVRDSILGREPSDWDITTSALPQQVKELFSHTLIQVAAQNRDGYDTSCQIRSDNISCGQ